MNENAEYFYTRQLNFDDLNQLTLTANRCFAEPFYSKNFFLPFVDTHLINGYISLGVFNTNHQLTAFICARILDYNDYNDPVVEIIKLQKFKESRTESLHSSAYVSLLGVDAAHRGKGLAKHLLNETKNHYKIFHNIREIYLHVQLSNVNAIQLYEKMGYSKLAVIDNYYQGNVQDAAEGSNDAYLCVKRMLN